ncbi:glycosyltransferase family 1 protein [Sphingomonas sp. SUN039]|uniref:glycosyltransferase family 4 protein n=1 Tax=Sphingomonas sp. SUN039 TaxID=2937787 RepID=UPI002164B919|nr:glycosyltransferase family 1 protein [Sphingomonas sp. SUN039]UVO54641.1 glycosyltransferase family 1 protein [Sphingomonas sp. SUN039]
MRIAIVTDAWEPQVNGVVRTLKATKAELEAKGHEVLVVSPDLYPNLPCPTYPEIRLALTRAAWVGGRLAAFAPDAVHLSTEGPLCLAARRWLVRQGWAFTTAYHTQFPDYFAARTGIDAEWVWPYFRWFHAASSAVLVSTPSVRDGLRGHGIGHSMHWSRGVDLDAFSTDASPHPAFASLPRPIQLYVGRVAIEKNIEAFLASSHPGTKVVVGDGPARAMLAAQYPDAVFLGALSGEELAGSYAGADVFVFPSRTDTFGLVMIEALVSGTPVAAFPVSGPIDIVTPATGALDESLDAAITAALTRDRGDCAYYGRTYTWGASAAQFVSALVPAIPPLAHAA